MALIDKYKEFPDHVWLCLYRRRLPRLVAAMRAKPRVKVLFVLHCLDKWKTEGLYRAMLAHERFEPVLGLAMSQQDYPSAAMKKFQLLKDYVAGKGYSYVELCQKDDFDRLQPDIIFYVEPYNGVINKGLEYRNARNSLFCFATYAIRAVCYEWTCATIFYKFLWQEYYENELSMRSAIEMCPQRRGNIVITGTPFTDLLLEKPQSDPWKTVASPDGCHKRKRIIYAPHYTIVDPHDEKSLYIGTFLQHGETMLELAKQCADTTQWAFKPHPSLWRELVKVWGEERTAAYYKAWAELDNGQFAEGQYLDLFKHSDAMIHDCGSFTSEYLYMQRPVLFLDNGHAVPYNYLGKAALDMHYHASTAGQIEQFVRDVIDDVDPRRDERNAFFKQCLLPPNGKTASENIIDAILGN